MDVKHSGCCHEERFAHIESDLAELKARMDNKKDDIQDINKELANDRQQQIELIEKVTEVTVLLKQNQKDRQNNNDKIASLENKIDILQSELSEVKNELTDYASSQRSFRNTVLALIPIISIIVGVILHYF